MVASKKYEVGYMIDGAMYLGRADPSIAGKCPLCKTADHVECWWEKEPGEEPRIRVCCMRCRKTAILKIVS